MRAIRTMRTGFQRVTDGLEKLEQAVTETELSNIAPLVAQVMQDFTTVSVCVCVCTLYSH